MEAKTIKKGTSFDLKGKLSKFLAFAVLILLYLFFAIFGRNFFTIDAAIYILDSSYYVAFMAIGITFVIITGGIDLSIGANMMCGALMGGLLFKHGVNIWICLAFIVAICTAIGLINGLLIAYLKLPPFIATLGTQMVCMGMGSIATKVQTMSFPTIGTEGSIFKSYVYKIKEGALADTFLNNFPTGLIWVLIAFIIAFILLNKTRFGRYTFAIGSNEEATRLSGVKVGKWKCIIYTFCGLFCGFAGIIYAGAYTSIIPGTGNGLEMDAIAGAIIGGTSMSGGKGSLTGTMIGVLIMNVLKQGLMSMQLQSQWQTFFTGIVIILAVLLDNYRVAATNKIKKVD